MLRLVNVLAQSLSAEMAALSLYLHLYLLIISFYFVKKFAHEVRVVDWMR